jgi:cytochrome c-type biogenesis protein CcmH
MTISIALTLVGLAAAAAAALLLVVHYGAGQWSLTPLVQSCGAELKEIEHKSREGLLGETEADTARIKVLLNLIAAKRDSDSRWWLLRGDRSALVIAVLAGVSVAALAAPSVFDPFGGPPVPGASQFDPSKDPDFARLAIFARTNLPVSPPAQQAGTGKTLPDVQTMNQRLAARLEREPNDVEGWRMLGWSWLHTQQPRKAAEAYQRAVALRPKSTELMVAYGEALVAVEAGTVTPKALDIFKAAAQIDGGSPKARYFLALAKEQTGLKREALEEWRLLLAAPLEDETWTAELRENAKRLATELGVDVASILGQTGSSPAKIGAANNPKQPTAEDIRQIEALPPDQRQALIRGMVEGLVKRLEGSPKDQEGWIMLIRSRVALGEQQMAREALNRALAAFPDERAAQSHIRAAAQEAGLSTE